MWAGILWTVTIVMVAAAANTQDCTTPSMDDETSLLQSSSQLLSDPTKKSNVENISPDQEELTEAAPEDTKDKKSEELLKKKLLKEEELLKKELQEAPSDEAPKEAESEELEQTEGSKLPDDEAGEASEPSVDLESAADVDTEEENYPQSEENLVLEDQEAEPSDPAEEGMQNTDTDMTSVDESLAAPAPEQRWMREYCKLHRVKMWECSERIDEEEAHCVIIPKQEPQALLNKSTNNSNKSPNNSNKSDNASSKTLVNPWVKMQDARCKQFLADKSRFIEDLVNTPTQRIGEAAKSCESAVQKVCDGSLCPAWSAMEGKNASNCTAMCNEEANFIWKSGNLGCGKDVPFAECLTELNITLKTDVKRPALAELMKQLVLKCICVSRADDKSMCYEGSMGIAPGTKWCEWDGTPSWQKLLSKAGGQLVATFPKPECNKEENTDIAEMAKRVAM